MEMNQVLEILERTPAVLKAELGGLSDFWIRGDEGPGSWTPFDVVGHLIHGEETGWIPRARIILEFGESRPFDPFDRTAMLERSKGQSLDDLLARFERLRGENLTELRSRNLSVEDMNRSGTHPDLGRVTLGQLLATWAAHDLTHLAQIARVMSRQYRNAVGPWKAYLPLLQA